MNYKRLMRRPGSLGAALVLGDAIFFGFTDPTRAPSTFFIIAFLLFAATLYVMVQGVCALLGWYGYPVKHRHRAGMVTAGGLSSLFALQSIGQLSTRDIAVLLPLVVLAYFYISYNRRLSET
jgi:hypothetical protein